MAGLWLGGYHPAGYVLTALPIVAWLGLAIAGFVARLQIGTRRRRAIRERKQSLESRARSSLCLDIYLGLSLDSLRPQDRKWST